MEHSLPNEIKITFLVALLVMFLLLAFIIVVALTYHKKQMFYLKERQLKEIEHENRLLQSALENQKYLLEERKRISLDMHDDLGAGISALKLQAEFLKRKINDENVREDIEDLLKTSEEMNISMREMMWSLNSDNDNLQNFVNYTINYAEMFFRKSEIKLNIKKTDIKNKPISAEVRRNLFLCIKEALNNIYKHSNAKNAFLTFTQDKKAFSIKISDDGIGIQNKKPGGNGLFSMENRINGICGSFEMLPLEQGSLINIKIDI